jgi:hypothetical protein
LVQYSLKSYLELSKQYEEKISQFKFVEQSKRPKGQVYQLQRFDCDQISQKLKEIQSKFYVDKFYYLHILDLQREVVSNILEMNPILSSDYEMKEASKDAQKLRNFIFKNQFVKQKSNFPTDLNVKLQIQKFVKELVESKEY